MLRVVGVVVVLFAGCDDESASEAPAAPQCLLISRPVATAFVSGALRRPVTRPTCVASAEGALAWADGAGVHVDVDGHVVDAVASSSLLQARPCLNGVAIGRHRALVQTAGGVVFVDKDHSERVVLPPLSAGEHVSGVGRHALTVARSRQPVRVVPFFDGDVTAIGGPDDTDLGHIVGDALVLDDGRRIDVGFTPTGAVGRGRIVTAWSGKRIRSYVGARLVYESERGESPVGASDRHLFVRRKGDVFVGVDEAGNEAVVYAARAGVTAAGVAYAGAREAVDVVVDHRERILVRERLRGTDCGVRDVVTLIDDAGAHVLADGDGARSNVSFWNGAPAWVESELSYEPVADANGTSDP